MKKSTVDELISDLICGYDITGLIDGEPAGVLNVREDYVTFFVCSKGRGISIDIPEEEFGPNTIVYKGKTIRELLEEDIIYNIVIF